MHITILIITSSMIIPAMSGLFYGEKFSSFKMLTAMKKAEDSDNVIIRVYNPTKEAVTGRFKCEFKNAKVVSLNEEYEKTADLDNITVNPYQILTIEVEK